MEISPARNLCKDLIHSAIWRCRISENLCRLSVTVSCLHSLDCPITQIKVADTGVGISFRELQSMEYTRNHTLAHKWDGVIDFTTTSMCDKEIFHYRLNINETIKSRRLKRLPCTSKNLGAFSGSEVSFSTQESFEELIPWITQFCQKILILKLPKVVVELQVERAESLGLRCKHLVGPNEDILLEDSQPRHVQLSTCVIDHILTHGNVHERTCQTCFSKNESPKNGYGVSCSKENIEIGSQTVEAVIVVTEVAESSNAFCMKMCGKTTKVLYFQDFTPWSFPPSSLNALTSIDWKSYGLTLKTSMIDGEGCAILDWETLPSVSHVDIVLHKFSSKYPLNLIKKAMKNALDDLKSKYARDFLSARAVQIQRYVPDLSRAIVGLIQSSNDSEFHVECASLLGLQAEDMESKETVESCITGKITKIIEENDSGLRKSRGRGPFLFEDFNNTLEEDDRDEEGARNQNAFFNKVTTHHSPFRAHSTIRVEMVKARFWPFLARIRNTAQWMSAIRPTPYKNHGTYDGKAKFIYYLGSGVRT
ncbi:hypothetical protein H6P81_009793 [Aristolochia fimbriata]|uniref:Type 2 DNA topoisomerase 6 subunit B-like n=1 Tax=Aristolochia fimbriata TaxID=158543 RepID=A0AAV7ELW4_ARIFI|nr:hypothetical protein H6P81_009793 [Aristolochia fimbriata]